MIGTNQIPALLLFVGSRSILIACTENSFWTNDNFPFSLKVIHDLDLDQSEALVSFVANFLEIFICQKKLFETNCKVEENGKLPVTARL